ncbi:alpha/beta hydrolase [Bacillus salitolerans]|uniref:Alpha/beta hydrolase n=1 Tax=Bacillus salitolerans TaxID=1437434 RepID=A0ABW4LWL4_9BACI
MWKWEADNPKGVIVIVHGAAEHHGRYRWLIEMWRCEGYHVIMGDLPGHGTTSRSQRGHINSFDEYIETVEMWYKEAQRYELPIFLLGHSMGGLIVIRSLQEKQLSVKGVMLSSPWLALAEGLTPSRVLNSASKVLNHLFPSFRFSTGLNAEMVTRNKEVITFTKNDSLYVKKITVRWFREIIQAHALAFSNINKFPDIPVLFMQSGSDEVVDKTKGKEWFDLSLLTDKTYKEWPGLYHELFNEPERDKVFEYAKRFVETQLELE